jgi:hypothetical protein
MLMARMANYDPRFKIAVILSKQTKNPGITNAPRELKP